MIQNSIKKSQGSGCTYIEMMIQNERAYAIISRFFMYAEHETLIVVQGFYHQYGGTDGCKQRSRKVLKLERDDIMSCTQA